MRRLLAYSMMLFFAMMLLIVYMRLIRRYNEQDETHIGTEAQSLSKSEELVRITNINECETEDAVAYAVKESTGFEGPMLARANMYKEESFDKCKDFCTNTSSCTGFAGVSERWGKECKFMNYDTLSTTYSSAYPKRLVPHDKSTLFTKTCQKKPPNKPLPKTDVAVEADCINGWKRVVDTRVLDRKHIRVDNVDTRYANYDEIPRTILQKCKDTCSESIDCEAFEHQVFNNECLLGSLHADGKRMTDNWWTSYIKC